jgi:CRISPR system Cascade subunit CasE
MNLCLVRSKPDPAAFARWAVAHRFVPERGDDLGYALHAALKPMLGALSPRPFYWRETAERSGGFLNDGSRATGIELYGYSHVSASELREGLSLANVEVDLRHALGLDGMDVRDMPTEWRVGRRLSFECRVRPIVKQVKAELTIGGNKRHREVDAAAAAWSMGERLGIAELDRPSKEAAYTDWLAKRLHNGGARLDTSRILSARRTRVLRRPKDHIGSRQISTIEGPDLVFRGDLEITDPVAFAQLLATGVGRHCGFGFGLLLVAPAGALA